jgi:hypothetical protein
MQESTPWEALNLERDNPDKEKQLELKRQRSRRFKAVFENENGEWVLEYLNGLYFDRQIVNPNDKEPMISASIRQGEQNVMRTIYRVLSYREE